LEIEENIIKKKYETSIRKEIDEKIKLTLEFFSVINQYLKNKS
jgi:uncharacterized membrane protein